MIARIRGEHDARWRWRPSAAREAADAPPRQTATVDDRQSGAKGLLRHRVLWWLLSVGVSIAVGCLAAIWLLSPSPARPSCQRRREAWLDAYEAAAIDNPSHVCSELFAPQLAEAYGNAVHGAAAATSGGSRASRWWCGGCCRMAARRCSSCARRCARKTGPSS